jgi:hypothetical protein
MIDDLNLNTKDFEELQTKILELKGIIASQDLTLSHIYEINKVLLIQNSELSTENSYLKSIIQTYKSSNSWKCTLPFRKISNVIRVLNNSLFS